MANKYKGESTITVDGKTKKMIYDMNALAELEDHFECNVEQLMDVLRNDMSIKNIRTFLWAGLIHDNEDLTEKEVGKWIGTEENPLKDVLEKMTSALKRGMGVSDDEIKNAQAALDKKNLEKVTK